MRLTDEQRKFAEENHNLIYGFMHQKRLDIDEWYGIVSIGFVKAAATFDKSQSEFSTYAYRCMNNSVNMEYRKKQIDSVSLNDLISMGDGESLERQEFIPNSHDFMEEIEFLSAFQNAYFQLKGKKQKAVEMALSGYKQEEISKHIGVSQAQVSRYILSFKKAIKEQSALC